MKPLWASVFMMLAMFLQSSAERAQRHRVREGLVQLTLPGLRPQLGSSSPAISLRVQRPHCPMAAPGMGLPRSQLSPSWPQAAPVPRSRGADRRPERGEGAGAAVIYLGLNAGTVC